MLSRFAFRSVRLLPTTVQGSQVIRATATTTNEKPLKKVVPEDDHPDISEMEPIYCGEGTKPPYTIIPFQSKDVRPENIPPVRMGFIPDSWFTFFYPKTGVTGPYMFLVGVSTYLCSKEIYVMEHEFVNSLTFFSMLIYGVIKFGPKVKSYFAKRQDRMLDIMEDAVARRKKGLKDVIEAEQRKQVAIDAIDLISDAKKQNIAVQLEAIHRERLATIYNNVKQRLDYHVQMQSVQRRLQQKYMSRWIISNVLKAITPEQEKAALQQCIKDLQMLAKA